MTDVITFSNNGQEVIETNFWQTDQAKKGMIYLSWNAGAARLLIPKTQSSSLKEIKTAKYVIISRGFWKEHKQEGLELLFEDNSDSPFCFHIGFNQTDRMLPDSDQGGEFIVTVWTEKGKMLEFPGKYRMVNEIPCLEPWIQH